MKMRPIVSCAFMASVFLMCMTNASAAMGHDEKAVLATVQSLPDGWREADAAKLDAVLDHEFREATLHLDDKEWKFAAVDRDSLIRTMAESSTARTSSPQVRNRALGASPTCRKEPGLVMSIPWNYGVSEARLKQPGREAGGRSMTPSPGPSLGNQRAQWDRGV